MFYCTYNWVCESRRREIIAVYSSNYMKPMNVKAGGTYCTLKRCSSAFFGAADPLPKIISYILFKQNTD
jgi:hypothetical protein